MPGLFHVLPRLLEQPAKQIVLSGPSGFLGSRTLRSLLEIHEERRSRGLEPGEIILLSSSPGNLMRFLGNKYSVEQMKQIRATRVSYFNQHKKGTWIDQLGALSVGGENSVFINLAALAGPIASKPDAMLDVNYHAAVSAAEACEDLGFGHFIQGSTQATAAERSGQVPYAKHKAMADYALARRLSIPVTIASLGLLYCRDDITVGQDRASPGMNTAREKGVKLNLIDLSLLPLTPIMGSGEAPLQPMEVSDASKRIAYLACSDPSTRPKQEKKSSSIKKLHDLHPRLRYYDAVGPETISIVELLRRFAKYQGKSNFCPVFIDYRHMERILNVKSLGNLNRQFVSLLRSEQDSISPPSLGDGRVWCSLLKPKGSIDEAKGETWDQDATLTTLEESFGRKGSPGESFQRRRYPYLKNIRFIFENPRVIWPGILLSIEIVQSWLRRKKPQSHQRGGVMEE